MSNHSYTRTITVDRTAEEAFAAINNPRAWWSAEITGDTANLGDAFVFDVPDVHRCTMTVTELVADRKVVWHVSDCHITFVKDTAEWDGTEVVFEVSTKDDGRTEIRFTHEGLVPGVECYDNCSDGWNTYVTGSLRSLITTGQGDPYRHAGTFETELRKHQNHKEMATS